MSRIINESKVAREFFRPHEVARKLCISQEQVRRHLRNGILPGFKLGKVWLVSAQELNRYLELREALFDTPDSM